MSTLAERIHRACPCRTTTPCQLGASLPKKTKTTCECGKDRFKVAHDWTLIVEPCKWEGHAIAGEAATVQRDHSLLRDAVNSNSGECKPSCDSYGHAEDCEYVDMSASLRIQQEKVAALTAKVSAEEELNGLLENLLACYRLGRRPSDKVLDRIHALKENRRG